MIKLDRLIESAYDKFDRFMDRAVWWVLGAVALFFTINIVRFFVQ